MVYTQHTAAWSIEDCIRLGIRRNNNATQYERRNKPWLWRKDERQQGSDTGYTAQPADCRGMHGKSNNKRLYTGHLI